MGIALLGMPPIFLLSEPRRRIAGIEPDVVAAILALLAVGMAPGAPVLATSMGSGTMLGPALLFVTDWKVPQLAAASNLFRLVVGVLSVVIHVQMGDLHGAGFNKVALGILPGVALGAWLSCRIGRSWFAYGMSAVALFPGAQLLG